MTHTARDGWKWVPVEPTREMLTAARGWSLKKNGQGVGDDQATGCFQAMLSAAPSPPSEVTREADQRAMTRIVEWMGERSYATGHGDTIEDLLGEIEIVGTPVADWTVIPDELVLIYVVHDNAQFESDEKKRLAEWEGWFVGRWINHNKGGWTWHGMMGRITHVAKLPRRPIFHQRGEKG